MNRSITLKELKGASLSIILMLMMRGNRAASLGMICKDTGYTDKPIRKALHRLQDLGLITQNDPQRWQLMDDCMQLPLFRLEAAGIQQPAARQLSEGSGEIPERIAALEEAVRELKQSVSGEIPEGYGKIPYRKPQVFSISKTECGNNPSYFGENPDDHGENPEDINPLINNTHKENSLLVDTDTNQQEDLSGLRLRSAGEIPDEAQKAWCCVVSQMRGQMDLEMWSQLLEKAKLVGYVDGHYTVGVVSQWLRDWADQRLTNALERQLSVLMPQKISVSWIVSEISSQLPATSCRKPERLAIVPFAKDAAEEELVDVINDYMIHGNGPCYSGQEYQELVSLRRQDGSHADPAVLRFILPRADSFEAAKAYAAMSYRGAKHALLSYYKIVGGKRAEIREMEEISLELIAYECSHHRGEEGLAIKKLLELQDLYQIPEEPEGKNYLPAPVIRKERA